MTAAIIGVIALIVGVAGGYLARKVIMAGRLHTAEAHAAKLMADAEREAETRVRDALREVKEEISAMRREAEDDLRLRREEVKQSEGRLGRREEQADQKSAELDSKEQTLIKAGGEGSPHDPGGRRRQAGGHGHGAGDRAAGT